MYLRIADDKGGIQIKGSVKNAPFQHWIELQSVQFGAGRAITGEAGTDRLRSELTTGTDVVVTKFTDAASNPLFKFSLDGHASPATISFAKTTGKLEKEVLRLDMANVLVSNFSLSSGGDRPMETLSLNFTEIKFTRL